MGNRNKCAIYKMRSIFSNLDLVGGEEEGHRSNLQMQLNWFENSYELQAELHYQQRGGAGGLGNEFALF